ncbi:hypothetical protein COOONC_13546, partial [Cooperia oncophora]
MAISKLMFVLVIIFGSSSWMGTNSIWMQLPLLTANLPEGWGLPSFLAAVVQIACIGPLIYTLLHKGCRSITLPTVPLITAFLTLASFCQLGAGHYECEGSVPLYSPPRFSASSFFFLIFCWTLTATVAFEILSRKGGHKNTPPKSTGSSAHEATPLNGTSSKSAESIQLTATATDEDGDEVIVKKPSSAESTSISGSSYMLILMATALVNAQMNGVIPSVQSYAALPYSQATYHYGIALANIVSPCMSFLPFFIKVRSIPGPCRVDILFSCMTAFHNISCLTESQSDLRFSHRWQFLIVSAMTAAGLHSYLRVVFASLLREGEQSESRLFWCGVFIQ